MKNRITENEALLVYYAHFHGRMANSIALWGASLETGRVFLKLKRAIRLIAGINCSTLFRKNNVLTTPSCYMLECFAYIYKNKENSKKYHEFHDYNTRAKIDMYYRFIV